jgi:hypothetical protein
MHHEEIGGYLELEHFGGREYHESALALNTARSCLLYLVEARGIERMWVPAFLCDSVPQSLAAAGVEVLPYEVREDLRPDYGSIDIHEGDYLYLVDYYGQLGEKDILAARDLCGDRLVLDEVQAFFRRPLPGIDTIYCCRKFFGVPDGGYLYTDAHLGRELPQARSSQHMAHILGRMDDGANAHYGEYSTSERLFGSESVATMSDITHNLLRAIDYKAVADARLRNFSLVNERLGQRNELAPVVQPGAYMYPFLTRDASPIRKAMQQRKVYVPTLWPGSAKLDGMSGRLSRDILPLPIDQRYGADDMNYVCDLLLELLDARGDAK